MSDIPDVLNTPILPAEFDDFWNDEYQLLKDLEPRDALFLTSPIETGSAEQGKLDAIIKACGLNDGQYHILYLAPDIRIAWHAIRDTLRPKYIVSLGIHLEQLAMSVQLMPHQVSRFDNCAFIPTLSVHQLDLYPDIKKHFWMYGLKPLFVDKVYG